MDFQVAQKLHACTDPHSEERRNNRVHDVVDLLLARETFFTDGDLSEPERGWPPHLHAHPHWAAIFPKQADEVGLTLSFEEAIRAVNAWIDSIVASGIPGAQQA